MKRLSVWVAIMVLAAGAAAATAEGPTLRTVMRQLGADLHALVDAIMVGDYEAAARAAGAIADHAHVGAGERARIQKILGPDMKTFKALDTRVHDTAVALRKAARERDTEAVVQRFGELVHGCTECHSGMRDRLRGATR
ncbi:MAG: cytochrome c [Gammaproteobacteria bacterium]|nr:cytochrome c [Gammaproteobacteria bacterium]NIR97897.1 cytochrome c [Gammaproteobacteria bacterium]NIT63602.1 cytochrome c [Gammaproteobacteria bacterium]NIV20538.1 cytochrome c [Gammaproteobacteria bacterium]NIX11132.1 cytochrome c [Gammaproteobacteria bacterium]